MRRETGIAVWVGVVASAFAQSARASGHATNGLGDLITLIAIGVGGVPWLVSAGLLGNKPSRTLWFFGSALSAFSALVVAVMELSAAYVVVALLPLVAHQVKLIGANVRGAKAPPPDAP